MLEKKYYSVEEAAQSLGLSPAEVNLLREKHELHGYRDGAAWKYKVEDVDALAKQRQLKDKLSAIEPGDETGDVLLSDVTVGGSESGSSGTVIGGKKKGAQDSDLRLADSDLNIGGPLSGIGPGSSKPGSSKIAGKRSDIGLGKSSGAGSGKRSDIGVGRETDKGSGKGSDKGSSKGSGKSSGMTSDLAMAGLMGSDAEPEVSLVEGINLDEGLTTLDEASMLTEAAEARRGQARRAEVRGGEARGDSSVDLDSVAAKSDDDNVVLGGSGAGSDITIGGDSGISLVDPTDSGLSLEEPLELAAHRRRFAGAGRRRHADLLRGGRHRRADATADRRGLHAHAAGGSGRRGLGERLAGDRPGHAAPQRRGADRVGRRGRPVAMLDEDSRRRATPVSERRRWPRDRWAFRRRRSRRPPWFPPPPRPARPFPRPRSAA